MAPVIVAQNLYKRYEGFPPVLRGVNIAVEPGEMVAIMGPSGCGKSTMLHVRRTRAAWRFSAPTCWP